MINNRQNNNNNNRRRNRNGPRPQGGGGGNNRVEQGNRIDSRARGNAPQLLEKYKNLARDAQMQGDRVMTEYYLQFADHYFRVLADNRTRQEEQQAQQQQRRPQQDMSGELEGVAMGVEGDPVPFMPQQPSSQQDDNRDNNNRGNENRGRDNRNFDNRGNDNRIREGRNQNNNIDDDDDNIDEQTNTPTTADRDDRYDDRERPAARPRLRRPRREDAPASRESRAFDAPSEPANAPARIDVAVLPPAINDAPATDNAAGAGEDGEPATPRRRGRPRRVVADAPQANDA